MSSAKAPAAAKAGSEPGARTAFPARRAAPPPCAPPFSPPALCCASQCLPGSLRKRASACRWLNTALRTAGRRAQSLLATRLPWSRESAPGTPAATAPIACRRSLRDSNPWARCFRPASQSLLLLVPGSSPQPADCPRTQRTAHRYSSGTQTLSGDARHDECSAPARKPDLRAS